MGKRTAPRSNRAEYVVKIGTRNVVSRLKISSGDYLGLKKAPDLINGKGKSIKRGSKGTKSFQLVLKKKVALDGVKIQHLSFPVDGKVTVKQFYSYAKATFSQKGIGAIISPDGILYAWDKIDHSGGGGLLPKLPQLPGNLGDYLDTAKDLITDPKGTIGGYIDEATGLPSGTGELAIGLGKYLL